MNPRPDPPELQPNTALFLDFDGTLAPLAARPQDAAVPRPVVLTLGRLQARLAGALAIVSGRPLDQIDAMLHPLQLPAAGSHGAERRNTAGQVDRRTSVLPPAVVAAAEALSAAHAGLLLERKPGGLALHYRARPELEQASLEALSTALAASPEASGWDLMRGHCVFELKARGISKGHAVQAFMGEAAFAGRVPVFVGDDVTDEDGIRAVQDAGGYGVRVGPGTTLAHYRLDGPEAVAQWLAGATSIAAREASA